MHSTGILLILCGIPVTILMWFVLALDGLLNLPLSDALILASCMITVEIMFSSVLLYAARQITKRRTKPGPENLEMQESEDA